MKEFLQILRRFVPPYKKYLGLSVLFNILSAVLNIFSFAALIPILQILFQVDGGIRVNEYMHWNGDWGSIKEVATNNLYYYIQEFIVVHSASTALLVIGIFLAFMTFLKTGAYFLSSATIIPIRTGIVRDIRNQIYQKINSLSLGFFSEERKGLRYLGAAQPSARRDRMAGRRDRPADQLCHGRAKHPDPAGLPAKGRRIARQQKGRAHLRARL